MTRLLTVEEAADALRVSPSLVYRLIRNGEMRAVTVGGRCRRVPADVVESLIAGL